MDFWKLRHPGTAIFSPDLATPGIEYAALAEQADAFATALPQAPQEGDLGFVLGRNDLASVVAYLGALRARRCLTLLPAKIQTEQLTQLLERYEPEWLYAPKSIEATGYVPQPTNSPAYRLLVKHSAPSSQVHPETALLLSTSGTTGSPKMVRLSQQNLQANAQAIAQYLWLTPEERAITALPLSYSYGLSVLNSHLCAGAGVIVTDEPVLSRAFWDAFRDQRATSLAGVPYIYQMLQRLHIERMGLDSLRTLTQAGGHLAEPIKREFLVSAADHGWRFFSMYGQTEATARISFVPPKRIAEKINSIGIAIPGGSLSLAPDTGELIYRGANVMMGYALGRSDLAQGDVLNSTLATGDLARCDDEGFFEITGRMKRIAKIFGNRINLDEVELMLSQLLGAETAALDGGDRIIVVTEANQIEQEQIRSLFGLHPSGFCILCATPIPHLDSGKKDYVRLHTHVGKS